MIGNVPELSDYFTKPNLNWLINSSHYIMHLTRFWQTDAFSAQTFPPIPEGSMLTLYSPSLLFSSYILFGINLPLIGTPLIGIKFGNLEGLQRPFKVQKYHLCSGAKSVKPKLFLRCGQWHSRAIVSLVLGQTPHFIYSGSVNLLNGYTAFWWIVLRPQVGFTYAEWCVPTSMALGA